MTIEKHQIYQCRHCKKVIEIVSAAGPIPVCCGDEMTLQVENTVDAAQEKHVPVVEKVEGGFKVTVGSVEHPMAEEHLIEWIEIIAGDTVIRKYLKAGDKPQATFQTGADSVSARAFCNLHGLWKSE